MEFRRSVRDEISCLRLAQKQAEGACIIEQGEEKTCKFSSEAECLTLTDADNFYENYLCSSPDINVSCERQTYTGCVEGRDEVYWFDSCENKENIYSSNKDASWNNGRVLSKEDSCSAGTGSIENPSCGNCDRFLGSMCGSYRQDIDTQPSEGNYICRDLNCVDEQGEERLNGESWCSYESPIGIGREVVGSRSYISYCEDGEIIREGCGDYRTEVCMEQVINIDDTGRGEETFAVCHKNSYQDCLEQENQEDCLDEESRDCFWFDTNIVIKKTQPGMDWFKMSWDDSSKGWSSKYSTCLPNFAPGIKFWEKPAKEYCSKLSYNCNVVYVKVPLKGWKCYKNCECEETAWTEMMNRKCSSLGDCGGNVNVLNEWGDGYSVSGTGKLNQVTPFVVDLEEGDNYNQGKYTLTTIQSSASKKAGLFRDMTGWTRLGNWRIITYFIYGIGIAIEVITWILDEILNPIFGWGDTKTKHVNFKCLPWQPPIGGEKCTSCQDDFYSCSEYKCKSLGAACKLINKETENATCIASVNDHKAPEIYPLYSESGNYTYTEIDKGFKITDENGNCIPEFTPVTLAIETDEVSQCKISLNYSVGPQAFENTVEYFGDNLFYMNHTMTGMIPSLESMNVFGYDPNRTGNFNFYVYCQDDWGNRELHPYRINTCVTPGPDLTAPIIRTTFPRDGSYLKYNITEQNLSIWINEPAECKWSFLDLDYHNMNQSFQCESGLEEYGIYGWNCNATLTDINGGENKFYIRCKDQPWLPESNESRVAMSQSYVLNLIGSAEPLEIDEVSPQGKMITGFEPITKTLRAETSGGVDGTAECKYRFSNSNSSHLFFNTGSKIHTQLFTTLYKGVYEIEVECEDEAGNKAKNQGQFEIKLDSQSPSVTRVYQSEGNLHINTNENAECKFSFDNCNFNWNNATTMLGIFKEHTISWNPNQIYYVECRDLWDNEPLGCSIIVKPTEIGEEDN